MNIAKFLLLLYYAYVVLHAVYDARNQDKVPPWLLAVGNVLVGAALCTLVWFA